jgi:cystathionine gamma-synthase/cystathionine gamma-lyase
MTIDPHWDLDTLAVHAAGSPDPVHGAVVEPIVLSTTFVQPEPGSPREFEYSRSGNPTRRILERRMAALEGGDFGFAFASGSAAATTLLHLLEPGAHIVSCDDVYGGTFRLFEKALKPLGITTTYVEMRQLGQLRAAITDQTRLVWMETPTNPLLKVLDIRGVAAIASEKAIPLVVDSTFATPVLQRPLELGASLVLHSTTKYINGHSDVVGGIIVTSDRALAERIAFFQNALGAVPSPMDCYLVLRGIKTLPIRMRRHMQSAEELARRLERAPAIRRVYYPGLPSHPDYDVCRRQMLGGGGMISLELRGGINAARQFLEDLRLFMLAESLGAVESLAEHPALMTHASIPAEKRKKLGISDSLIRLSIGLESADDLWADLSAALDKLA